MAGSLLSSPDVILYSLVQFIAPLLTVSQYSSHHSTPNSSALFMSCLLLLVGGWYLPLLKRRLFLWNYSQRKLLTILVEFCLLTLGTPVLQSVIFVFQLPGFQPVNRQTDITWTTCSPPYIRCHTDRVLEHQCRSRHWVDLWTLCRQWPEVHTRFILPAHQRVHVYM